MNIADAILLLIVVLSVVLGYRQGFFKTLTGFLSVLLSLVISISIYPHVFGYLKDTPIYETVFSSVESVVRPAEDNTDDLNEYGVFQLNLPNELIAALNESIDTKTENITVAIVQNITDSAINILSILLSFLAVRLVLFLMTLIGGFIRKMPIIGFGDGLLGALFGFLRGLAILYILLLIVTFFSSLSPENSISKVVKNSEVARVLYHNNIVLEPLLDK